MPVSGKHKTASERRSLAISALARNLDLRAPDSAASRFSRQVQEWTGETIRPVAVSGDIDGLVSVAMLASVIPNWKVVAVVGSSAGADALWVHPEFRARPADVFGIDLFSLNFDNISNHILLYGDKKLHEPAKLEAFRAWDEQVRSTSASRLFLSANLWAGIQACYPDDNAPVALRARSAKYKYPLGTAQLMLALLEVIDLAPKFFDHRYLPWLVANCDGGVSSFKTYADNVSMWWSTLAACVGPGTLSEMVYRRVADMRMRDFDSAVDALSREFADEGRAELLDDRWNLRAGGLPLFKEASTWLCALTGWNDPFLGGSSNLDSWLDLSALSEIGKVKLGEHDAVDPAVIKGGVDAVNVNFRMGGPAGDLFNWVKGWPG